MSNTSRWLIRLLTAAVPLGSAVRLALPGWIEKVFRGYAAQVL